MRVASCVVVCIRWLIGVYSTCGSGFEILCIDLSGVANVIACACAVLMCKIVDDSKVMSDFPS